MIHRLSARLACFALALLLAGAATAQDNHYSQFYNMPLLLNPAMTGHFEGSYRVRAHYRNQWASITSGGVYNTPSAAFDMSFPMGVHAVSGGLALLSDRGGDGDISETGIMLSAAYHWNLDGRERHYLSIGLQGELITKRADLANIVFEDQFNNAGGIGQPSTEALSNDNISNSDLRIGLVYAAYPSDAFQLKIGASYLHVLSVDESFLGSQESVLPSRIVVHGEAKYFLNPTWSLRPNLLFMQQAGATQFNLGANVGYQTSPDLGLLAGLGYRAGDAAIFAAGADYKGFNLMFSYDLTVSTLADANSGNGGLEFGAGYIGRLPKKPKPVLPAIRFY